MVLEDIIIQLNKATNKHYIIKREATKPSKSFGSFNTYSIELFAITPKDVVKVLTVKSTAAKNKEELKEEAELELIQKIFKLL